MGKVRLLSEVRLMVCLDLSKVCASPATFEFSSPILLNPSSFSSQKTVTPRVSGSISESSSSRSSEFFLTDEADAVPESAGVEAVSPEPTLFTRFLAVFKHLAFLRCSSKFTKETAQSLKSEAPCESAPIQDAALKESSLGSCSLVTMPPSLRISYANLVFRS